MIKARIRKTDKRKVYDVRLRDPSGREYSKTFLTEKDAKDYEARERADRSRGAWIDPRRGKVTLNEWADQWMALRPDLRPRTRDVYGSLLRLHIVPELGKVQLGKLSPSRVRAWHARLQSEKGPGAATAAKAYRLLRAIMSTAVEDEVILRNPCRVEGAGVEHSPERPVVTVAQVDALADAIVPRMRALVLLAAWCGLRRGELLGLERRDLDLVHGTLRVERAMHELDNGMFVVGPPKTMAGQRTVAIPPHLLPQLRVHVETYVAPDRLALVFTGEKGGPLRPHVLQNAWHKARTAVGLPTLHLHDLRHTGNTWAAATGASTKELMARMGHANSAAALRYQHATTNRDRIIAQALSELVSPGAAIIPLRRPARGGSDQTEGVSRDARGMDTSGTDTAHHPHGS